MEQLLAHLQDKIEDANAEAKESHVAAMNSYGAGFDRGYADALIELQNALLITQLRSPAMRIKELTMKFGNNSQTIVDVWAECHTTQDCDQIIGWLQLAKANMKQWEKINAKASRTAKAPVSKDEAPQQGEVLSAA